MAALLLAAGGLLAVQDVQGVKAQTAVSPGRASENYRLRSTETPGRGRDVPGLAVNPANPDHIVEFDADYLNGECDYHTSFDGGRTWAGGHLTARNNGENPPFPGSPAGRLPCDQNFDSGGYAHVNTSVVFGSGENVYVAFSSHRGPFNRPESGANERAALSLGAATGGTFSLSFSGETTAPVARNATAAQVQAALEALAGLDPGDVVATGGPLPGATVTVTFSGRLAARDVPDMTGSGAGLTGGALALAVTQPRGTGGAGDDSLVARSRDGGRTFEPAVVAIPGQGYPTLGPLGQRQSQPFAIRPQVGVQPRAGVNGNDRLYANAWTCFIRQDFRASSTAAPGPAGGCQSGSTANSGVGEQPADERQMLVSRSDDGGTTWTAPVVASRSDDPATTTVNEREPIREPAQPLVGPDGTVYVGWENRDVRTPQPPDNNPMIVARSTDLGRTWTRVDTGAAVTGTPDAPGRAGTGASSQVGHPRLAIDPRGPAPTGTLYLVYQGPTLADPDILMRRSTNGGLTWSGDVRVSDAPASTNQTNPYVSVAPDGRVDVVWFDNRNNFPGSSLGDIYYASSSGSGATFSAARRVTDRSFNRAVGLTGVGGYTWYGPTSVPLGNDKVLVSWTDSREGDFNTGVQDVYLARLDVPASSAIPASSIATATAPGLSVSLSRLAYTGGGEAVGGRAVTRPVVVNEGDAASAMAGAVLARANYGPVLLSPPGELPAAVKADATRLEAVGGFVIGDSTALSSRVTQDLATTTGGESVERLAGVNPPDTARLIAERMDLRTPAQKSSTPPAAAFPTVVIVNPATPEAAAGVALAASLRFPILFVDQSSVPAPTATALANLATRSSTATNRALVIGGPTAVSDTVMAELATALGQAPKRLGGADAKATSEAVVAESRARLLPTNVVYVADGARPVDAATIGAAVGRLNGAMLLTPGGNTATAEASLTTLGIRSIVDRMVGIRGVGGVDPPVSTEDPGGPEETGGDPGRLSGVGADGAGPVVFSPAPSRSTSRRAAAAATAPPRPRVSSAPRPAAAPQTQTQTQAPAPAAPQAAPTVQAAGGETFPPPFPRAIGDQSRTASTDEDGGGVPGLLIALILLALVGAGLLAWGLTRRRSASGGPS